jgi:hypothetical protein
MCTYELPDVSGKEIWSCKSSFNPLDSSCACLAARVWGEGHSGSSGSLSHAVRMGYDDLAVAPVLNGSMRSVL